MDELGKTISFIIIILGILFLFWPEASGEHLSLFMNGFNGPHAVHTPDEISASTEKK
mgnify:CR=1 FL=1